jgi:OmcA/MtrC family decaheme c-type cytochrome
LLFHGGNRTTVDSCITCHNPRNTDRAGRVDAEVPQGDNKTEESISFKTLIHGIHAPSVRETPLHIYDDGEPTVFDTTVVHYPGNVGNCTSCHTDDGYKLPIATSALGTTIDTGDDFQDPGDDLVITPVSSACSGCHDDAKARGHMETNGGSFATSQSAIDSGAVLEQCDICHASGREAAVESMHPVR